MLAVVWLTGCATTVELPSNAHIIEGTKGWQFLDKVDFSYTVSRTYAFAGLQLCVTQNVFNQVSTLTVGVAPIEQTDIVS